MAVLLLLTELNVDYFLEHALRATHVDLTGDQVPAGTALATSALAAPRPGALILTAKVKDTRHIPEPGGRGRRGQFASRRRASHRCRHISGERGRGGG